MTHLLEVPEAIEDFSAFSAIVCVYVYHASTSCTLTFFTPSCLRAFALSSAGTLRLYAIRTSYVFTMSAE